MKKLSTRVKWHRVVAHIIMSPIYAVTLGVLVFWTPLWLLLWAMWVLSDET